MSCMCVYLYISYGISYPAISSLVNPDSSLCINMVVFGNVSGSTVPNRFPPDLTADVEISDFVERDLLDGDDIKEVSNGSLSSSRQIICTLLYGDERRLPILFSEAPI